MRKQTLLKSWLLLFAIIAGVGNVWAEEIATATFDGKNETYTEGWTTTGTGKGRTDCIIIGAEENITSPAFDLSGYSKVTISIKARRYGTLTGSKATIDASIGGNSVGTTDATGTSATTSLTDITFTPSSSMTKAVLVFTCTNATSAGSSHGAGINSITLTGTKAGETVTYTVTYDANGATSGTVPVDETEYEANAQVTVKGNTGDLAKSNFEFDGWNTKADGSGDSYNAGGTFSITGNTTLYAKWKAVSSVVDYVTLPFSWEGGSKADLTALDGVTANGLGDNYSQGNYPYLVKFDTTGDYILIKTDSQPGKVTIGVKMLGGSDSSKITVQGSSDGETFTDVEALTISGAKNDVLTLETSSGFGANDRYVKLVFTKGSNVGVGPITIAKPSTDPQIVANGEVELAYNATSGEIAYTINNPVDGTSLSARTEAEWISNVRVATDKVTFTTTANEGAERTATVTLTYGTLTKDVTVIQTANPNAPGSENNPYTVAQAIEATPTPAEVYIKGIVSSFYNTSIVGDGTNYRYYISDDGTTGTELLIYKGKGLDNEAFTKAGDLLVGDEVIIYGKLTMYQNAPEVASGNYIVSLTRPEDTTPSIAVDPMEVNVDAAEHEGTITVTYKNVDTTAGVEIVWYSDSEGTTVTNEEPSWIYAEINDENNVHYLMDPNTGEARTAYLKVYGLDNDANDVYSELITITQAAYVEPGDWVETTLGELTENDVFVIVGDNGSTYAMSNDKGTSAAPDAVAVTVVENTLYGDVPENIQWNVSSTDDGYIFYPNGSTETWLYCTNSNNGVRVGEGDAKHFTLGQDGYLSISETEDKRWIGIYSSQDWRSYTSINANIKDQTFKFYKKVVTEPESVIAEVSEYKWATFSCEYDLDFTEVEGVKAYIVTGAEGNTIVTEPVTRTVKANTGLLLYKEEAGECEIPVTEEGDDYSNSNKLIAVTKDNTAIEKATVGTNYVLTVRGEKAVFAYIADVSATLNKGKAYLNLNIVEGDAPAPFLGFDGEGTTGINSVERGAWSVEGCYTLDGRRVAQPTKGLYIVNGKKVMVK